MQVGVVMDPTEAQRLARLRSLLVDARRRVDDESELGIHLATLAIDGIGELAIGLCLAHCKVEPKRRGGLPARLEQLLEELNISPPGLQAFRELHGVRNLVQHAGVLPAGDQLPRWLTETEALIDALVKATFGVGMSEVSASSGIKDDGLQESLSEAESKLETGDAEGSFDSSWKALEAARRKFRTETGLHGQTAPIGRARDLRRIDRNLGSLFTELEALADQIELSAFTAEPGEWLWLRQRQGERFRGLPITAADAKRAFAFVLSWVLWFESYISRHNVDRWERWQEEQRAPSTGRPGGPHIADVRAGHNPGAPGGRTEGLRQWIFELTDVPDTRPPFDWAVTSALDAIEDSPLSAAYLMPDGGLAVSCSAELEPAATKAATEEVIERAKAMIAERVREEGEDSAWEAAILDRFASGLQGCGCEVKKLALHRSDRGYRVDVKESLVWIQIEQPDESNQSWLSKGLEESFERHFPESSGGGRGAKSPYRTMWHDVAVPITWEPRRVAAWIEEAVDYDREKRSEQERERRQDADSEESALSEMRRLIDCD